MRRKCEACDDTGYYVRHTASGILCSECYFRDKGFDTLDEEVEMLWGVELYEYNEYGSFFTEENWVATTMKFTSPGHCVPTSVFIYISNDTDQLLDLLMTGITTSIVDTACYALSFRKSSSSEYLTVPDLHPEVVHKLRSVLRPWVASMAHDVMVCFRTRTLTADFYRSHGYVIDSEHKFVCRVEDEDSVNET